MKRTAHLSALLAATLLVLAGCGTSDTSDTESSTSSTEVFNDADVSFATDMIPHHAQALVMVDMTRGRDLDPEFQALAEQISAAQGPEIETMTQWLRDWDQPIPETSRDHVNGEGHSDMDGMDGMDADDMPGMMGDDELNGLDSSTGSAFEAMWLDMMIQHHEGAIEMAKVEVTDGKYADSTSLAGEIITGQEAEITQMQAMLDE